MFAYKTTSGSAPLYLNSLLQTYRSLHSASECRFIVHLKEAQNHFHRLLNEMFPPDGMTCPTQSHLQESAKNTYLPSLFYTLTLAISILILFLKKQTKKTLAPFKLALFSFTNCLFSYIYIYIYIYVYVCVKLTLASLFYLFLFVLLIIQLTKTKKASSLLYSFSILSVLFLIYYIILKNPCYMYYSLNIKNNNKINTAPLTLDQVFIGQWHSLFQLPQNSNVPTMRLNTPRP